MIKRILSALLFLVSLPALPQPHHVFSTQDDHFTLDGKPFKILSGELHYARIPREYWHARLKMARAMGLNTIATYVFWNVHEPTPGHFDFTGNNDLAAFIRAAQEEGFYVILRSGPYACAEWELGGLPPGSSRTRNPPTPSAPTTPPSWFPPSAGSNASPRKPRPSRSVAAAPSS